MLNPSVNPNLNWSAAPCVYARASSLRRRSGPPPASTSVSRASRRRAHRPPARVPRAVPSPYCPAAAFRASRRRPDRSSWPDLHTVCPRRRRCRCLACRAQAAGLLPAAQLRSRVLAECQRLARRAAVQGGRGPAAAGVGVRWVLCRCGVGEVRRRPGSGRGAWTCCCRCVGRWGALFLAWGWGQVEGGLRHGGIGLDHADSCRACTAWKGDALGAFGERAGLSSA